VDVHDRRIRELRSGRSIKEYLVTFSNGVQKWVADYAIPPTPLIYEYDRESLGLNRFDEVMEDDGLTDEQALALAAMGRTRFDSPSLGNPANDSMTTLEVANLLDELVSFVEDMDEWMAASKTQPSALAPYTTIPYAPDPRFQLKVPIIQPTEDLDPDPHDALPTTFDNSNSLVDLLMQPAPGTTTMGVTDCNPLLPYDEVMEVVEL
jgi:hypothetical protein